MSVSLTIMTFNLHDDQPEDSANSWEKRKDLCISVITSYSPLILCTQQGLLFYYLIHLCFLPLSCWIAHFMQNFQAIIRL